MDEVFGQSNFVSQITVRKTTSEGATLLGSTCDFVLWFAKNRDNTKANTLFMARSEDSEARYSLSYLDGSRFRLDNITSSRPAGAGDVTSFHWFGQVHGPGKGTFKTKEIGLTRIGKADRLVSTKGGKLNYRRSQNDFGFGALGNLWNDISGAVQSRSDPKVYVVQSSTSIVERCLLLASDPGDLVLDPTCGSGTTAFVAEQWGRRWITIDTSRVALALARARIMGARYSYYLLADSKDGRLKEAEVTRTDPSNAPTRNNIRHGFVYERVPHITLKSIANNMEIDVIWEKHQQMLEPLREQLCVALSKKWEEWEIPREADAKWSDKAKKLHTQWWEQRIARQKEIDASIAAKAEFEFLYDKPYEDKKKVRVAGPFTVESLSPHRMLGVGVDDELLDPAHPNKAARSEQHSVGPVSNRSVSLQGRDREGAANEADFSRMILENLKTAGVQQAQKEDKITFTSIAPWPGRYICAEGRYLEGNTESGKEKRAGIFVGPEFGTVQRQDLVTAAREAGDADFDVLIACAFNYEAHASEFTKLGRIHVLKARMNADLHMADTLKNTGKGNLFVIFGEPDIDILPVKGGPDSGKVQVKINGVDVFHPSTGEVRSDGADGIACWFIDTDYNEESFFVRHAYFLGANDPYKSLKTTLKAEINEDAWATLNSDTSRPFEKPKSGRIAVKVINHLGDEVMKVFKVE